jgi:hypothetical protein
MWGTAMETNRIRLEQSDEAWIAKYRAALDTMPLQKSHFMRLCGSLTGAGSTLVSQIRTIVSSWNRDIGRQSLSVNQLVAASQSRTATREVTRVEVIDEIESVEAAQKPKPVRPLPARKYRAG